MKVRRRSGATRRREATEDPEVDHALDAMGAPELRAVIRVVLDQLDDGVKRSVIDALLARAAKATSGWKPSRPSPRIVEEAKSFSDAARQIGHADPDDVTEHLRLATKPSSPAIMRAQEPSSRRSCLRSRASISTSASTNLSKK